MMEKEREVCDGCKRGEHYLMNMEMLVAAEGGFTSCSLVCEFCRREGPKVADYGLRLPDSV